MGRPCVGELEQSGINGGRETRVRGQVNVRSVYLHINLPLGLSSLGYNRPDVRIL